MYRYLFFDFDGTLYDTVEGITRCVQYALRKRGLDVPWNPCAVLPARPWTTCLWRSSA